MPLDLQVPQSRWGADDEKGAANEVLASVTLAAVALVKQGVIYDLSQPISPASPRMWDMSPYNISMWSHPVVNRYASRAGGATNEAGFSSERVEMDFHTGTHIDALGHCAIGDYFYNRISVESAATNWGLTRVGIEHVPPLVTRGVLIDVRSTRMQELKAGEAISSADLEGAIKAQRSELRPGDIAMVRTGWGPIFKSDPQRYAASESPGLGLDGSAWLVERRVSAIATDTMALEVLPPEQPHTDSPVHQFLLAKSGVYIIENVNLEELASNRIYEFLCLCLPLPLMGATASPLRLVAVV